MTSKSYPSPAYNSGDLTEEEYELLASGYMPNGLIGVPSALPIVYADSSGMHVKFRANRSALLEGQRYDSGTSDVLVDIASNSGGTRFDLVTLRLDRTAQLVVENVITGAGTLPSPVTQPPGSGVFDMQCASVQVNHGDTTIAGSQVKPLGYYIGDTPILCTKDTRPPQRFGREIREYDTGKRYISDGANWVLQGEDTGYVALNSVSGWSASIATARRVNGLTSIRLETTRSGGELPRDTPNTIAQVPTGFTPTRVIPWVGFVSGAPGLPGSQIRGQVETDGGITIIAYNLLDTVTISGKDVLVSGAKLITGAFVVANIPAYAIGG